MLSVTFYVKVCKSWLYSHDISISCFSVLSVVCKMVGICMMVTCFVSSRRVTICPGLLASSYFCLGFFLFSAVFDNIILCSHKILTNQNL